MKIKVLNENDRKVYVQKYGDDIIKISKSMIEVEGGTFQSGKPNSSHEETVETFYMCDHPVTIVEYLSVTGVNLRKFFPNDRPMSYVSWYDAIDFCNRLSEMEGLIPCYKIDKNNPDPEALNEEDEFKWIVIWNRFADGYRLPTKEEWEFAIRGGVKSKGYKYSGSDNIDEVAWYKDNSDKTLHLVKQKKPNELGLYDMSGNILEWGWDWYYDENGAATGHRRIYGGGCLFDAADCDVTDESWCLPHIKGNCTGFRVVRSAKK